MEGSGAPLTIALNIIRAQVLTGFGLIEGDVYGIFNILLLISGLMAIFVWYLDGRPVAAANFLAKYVGFCVLSLLLQNYSLVVNTVYGVAVELGLRVGGSRLAPESFFDPGAIATAGLAVARPLREHIYSLTGWYEWLPNGPEIVFYFIMMLAIVASFLVIAWQIFFTVLEFLILNLATFVCAPWAIWNRSAFLAERAMGYCIAVAVKLLVAAIIFSISEAILTSYRWSDEPAIDEALGVTALVGAIFYATWAIPKAAAGMINGGPSFTLNDALSGLIKGGRAAAMIGGAAAGAAAWGGKAGAAAIRGGLARLGGASGGGGVRGIGSAGSSSGGGSLGGGGLSAPGSGSPSPSTAMTRHTEPGAAERYSRGLAGYRQALEAPTMEGSYERI